MKYALAEMLKAHNFIEGQFNDEETAFFTKTYEKDTQTCWHGTVKSTLKVDITISQNGEWCRATFYKDSYQAYKSRTYLNIGKRTFNAIAETIKNAGFEI